MSPDMESFRFQSLLSTIPSQKDSDSDKFVGCRLSLSFPSARNAARREGGLNHGFNPNETGETGKTHEVPPRKEVLVKPSID